jgi:hypothetical protein
MSKHTVVHEVAAELKKPENKGVIASVNTETGEVSAFMAPKPYWETAKNDASDTGRLTAAEVTALEKERNDLIASLPRLKLGARSKATTRINAIESTLRRARSNAESDRQNVERQAERPLQRYGQPTNTEQRSTNKLTWAGLRAELDAKLAAHHAKATQQS